MRISPARLATKFTPNCILDLRNVSHAGWHLRIKLSRMAADLACRLVKADDCAHGRRDAYWFFTRDMQINFASPQVIVVYAQCADTLMAGH